ncbi:regulator of chromosome condensation (RCC1) family protein isoform X2 [Tasmannia lanceolata]|uniref:regulator of chromosome condensation (RCC1) family protein isoform X2 n=1 Tax=Tasmannia lanceolata TaxID=3420 RepID=UPI004063AAFE
MWWRRCLQEASRASPPFTNRLGLGLGLGISRRWIQNDSSSGTRKRLAALWGNGDYGRLGLGSLDSRWEPAICPAFDNDSPRAIACGGAHTLFLTDKGRVYATGLNDFGQLGIASEKKYTLEPIEVSGIPQEVIQIAAGYHHSSAITVDGELYMWGNNSSGQLGLGRKAEKKIYTPSRVECLAGIHMKMVALGSEHSIAVTDDGDALSWGAGGSGRLGHGHQSSILGFLRSSSEYTPRLIKNIEGVKVRKIAAGLLQSACIDEQGSVFAFGERTIDKLGFGEANNATSPAIVSELPFSQEVACGGYHTCVITSNRELYTWGSNENGCLGIGYTDVIHTPEKVEGPLLKLPVFEVSCGWKHTGAICGGNLFTWGWGGSNGTFSVDGYSSGGQLVCFNLLGMGMMLTIMNLR